MARKQQQIPNTTTLSQPTRGADRLAAPAAISPTAMPAAADLISAAGTRGGRNSATLAPKPVRSASLAPPAASSSTAMAALQPSTTTWAAALVACIANIPANPYIADPSGRAAGATGSSASAGIAP